MPELTPEMERSRGQMVHSGMVMCSKCRRHPAAQRQGGALPYHRWCLPCKARYARRRRISGGTCLRCETKQEAIRRQQRMIAMLRVRISALAARLAS